MLLGGTELEMGASGLSTTRVGANILRLVSHQAEWLGSCLSIQQWQSGQSLTLSHLLRIFCMLITYTQTVHTEYNAEHAIT